MASDRWHPAILLYRWKADDKNGTPIFSKPIEVAAPMSELASVPGYLFTDNKKQLFGFWLRGDKLVVAKFDKQSRRFDAIANATIEGLPRKPSTIAVRLVGDNHLEGFVSVADGIVHQPGDHRDKKYTPYDGAGIWRGGLPRSGIYGFACDWPELPQQVDCTEVLASPQGGLLGINSLEWVASPETNDKRLLLGTKLGGLFSLSGVIGSSTISKSLKKDHIFDTHGKVIRHPTVSTNITAYPATDGSRFDMIVGGEGGLYYYLNAKRLSKNGELVFESPRRVLQESPELYAGSLIVPNIIDWNGDDKLDIVAGNSAGRILFFENQGTNSHPRFQPAVHIASAGEPVLIQGGYRGSIQGPGEAHWGYTCPLVVDWNQDSLPDIVMNDIRGIHTVYLNEGTATSPKLALPHELIVDSLELHGTWRTRPAAGMLGDRMAYITLDDDDQLHLYWQIDSHNLEEGGKLLLKDGSPIQANFLPAGGTGRAKFQLVDWDRDGAVDLLVGTPRHGSFPEPKRGVPWSMARSGSAVLLLKNVGSNAKPIYAYPAVMHVAGKPMHFGQHSCAPFASSLGSGDDKRLNIVVGTEIGKMYFFHGEDIEWKVIR